MAANAIVHVTAVRAAVAEEETAPVLPRHSVSDSCSVGPCGVGSPSRHLTSGYQGSRTAAVPCATESVAVRSDVVCRSVAEVVEV